jgi:hypothetical protein
MKTIIITDQTTNLHNTLIEQYPLHVINNTKSQINQVINSIDKLLSAGYDVIYLSDSKLYKVLSLKFESICNMYPNSQITIINLDSIWINKNNLAIRILESECVENIILKYNLKHKTYFGDICFDNVIKSDLGASILI